jgi:hypothetical protein
VGTDGNLHWGLRALAENRRGLRDLLARDVYAQIALTPAYPWLDRHPPGTPDVKVEEGPGDELKLRVNAALAQPAWLWVLQRKVAANWTTDILPGTAASLLSLRGRPEVMAVSAVDRCGNASAPWVVEKAPVPEPPAGP